MSPLLSGTERSRPQPLTLDMPLVENSTPQLDGRRETARPHVRRSSSGALRVKRAADVVSAIFVLALCAPLMVLIALMVRLDSPGPVIFAQRRVGRGGRPFSCLKFRTMQVDAEARLRSDQTLLEQFVSNGHKLPLSVDPRVTRVGRLLRRSSLDELPQLLNILVGHMSFVGPRPVTAAEVAYFDPNAAVLLSMRPGLTGLWAVSGRSTVSYPKRATLELAYVGSWSLRLDLQILVKTVTVVLTGTGAT